MLGMIFEIQCIRRYIEHCVRTGHAGNELEWSQHAHGS